MAGFCGHGNESSGAQNTGNLLTSRGKFNFLSKVLLHGDLIIHEPLAYSI